MIFYLCRIFQGTQVDGINFQEIMLFKNLESFVGKQLKFRLWLVKWLQSSSEKMMEEYIRLTNIAFGTANDAPPVFLLDEVQFLRNTTDIISGFGEVKPNMHTRLSLLLTQLAGKLKPVCICTGTNSGNIISITENSTILPQVLSLGTIDRKIQ